MWTWEIISGRMYSDDGELKGVGYSGNGEWKNDPASQHIKDHGPIPCGRYTILSPQNTETHGPYVLSLLPDASTTAGIEVMGRDPDSFLIHGDKASDPGNASKGCIILSRDVRETVWESKDHVLQVVEKVEADQ